MSETCRQGWNPAAHSTSGVNKDIPSGWMIYITVEDLDKSIEQVKKLGGEILAGPKNYGSEARYCIIKDPSGSGGALYAEN